MSWIARTVALAMYFSVVSIAEVRAGLGTMPLGKRRAGLETWLQTTLIPHFRGRIIPVTEEIAADCGDLFALCRKSGHMAEPMDALIAATARVHGMSVVTLNRKHFEPLAVPIVSP
jgi:predicted nucleic acid-binding protein